MTKEKPRHLRWGLPEAPIPQHPYRDTMLVYAFSRCSSCCSRGSTGGSVGKAVVIAAVVWAAASIWSIARWRQRLRREAAEREEAEDIA